MNISALGCSRFIWFMLLPFYWSEVVDFGKLSEKDVLIFRREWHVLWNAGLATLTTGSVIKGVLDIYGSSNKLVLIFLIVGLTDLVLALIIGSSKREHDIEKEGDSLLS